MSKLNKDSNAYVLIFLAIMATVVALVLALLSQGLKPTIEANKALDERTKILKSVVFKTAEEETEFFSADYVNSEYLSKVTAQMINRNGDVVADSVPSDYNYKETLSLPEEEQQLPLYTYESDGEKYYIMKMIGLGLWDEINGYIAIDANDVTTIKGVAFDHKGETPGLGAEITKSWFRQAFNGDVWIDENGNYKYTVYKANKMPTGDEPVAVDGISGATLTTVGVNDMVEKVFYTYENLIKK